MTSKIDNIQSSQPVPAPYSAPAPAPAPYSAAAQSPGPDSNLSPESSAPAVSAVSSNTSQPPKQMSTGHAAFKVNIEKTITGSATPKPKVEVLMSASEDIGKPVFALSDPKNAADFDAYRQQYRSFRVGKARGAKGEVSQFVKKPVKTPHIVPPFLTKLYDMVNSKTYSDLIRWSEDGTAIVISSIQQFSEIVLPQYFKHSKFASFLRQLNMYNFYTTRQEPQLREFKNPFFIRGKLNLMSGIKRKRAQTKAVKESVVQSSKRQRIAKSGSGKAGPRSRKDTKSKMTKPQKSKEYSEVPMIAMKRQLSLAIAQAKAARTACSSLQRAVDESHREISHMKRNMDNMMSCLEQVCSAMGSETWQIFSSLFVARLGSDSFSSHGSHLHSSSRKSSSDMHDFMIDSFYEDVSIGLGPNTGMITSANSLDANNPNSV